jgi:hypothetical protein
MTVGAMIGGVSGQRENALAESIMFEIDTNAERG